MDGLFFMLQLSKAAQPYQNELSENEHGGNVHRKTFWLESSQDGDALPFCIPISREYVIWTFLPIFMAGMLFMLITAKVVAYLRPTEPLCPQCSRLLRNPPHAMMLQLPLDEPELLPETDEDSDSEAESDDSDEDPYTDTEWTPRRYNEPDNFSNGQPRMLDNPWHRRRQIRRLRAAGQAQQVPVTTQVPESSTTNYSRENSNLNAVAPAWDRSDQMDTNDNNTEDGVREGGDDTELLRESSIDLGAECHSDQTEKNESTGSRAGTNESAVEDDDQAVPELSVA